MLAAEDVPNMVTPVAESLKEAEMDDKHAVAAERALLIR